MGNSWLWSNFAATPDSEPYDYSFILCRFGFALLRFCTAETLQIGFLIASETVAICLLLLLKNVEVHWPSMISPTHQA